ncbi:MAG TPA: TonB-dependent receptor [Gemmatimonadaceae bacterium]
MIPRPFYLAVVAFATPLSLLSAQVARDTAHASPIVVTATRTPLSIVRSPATISVITGDELRREGIVSVVDALRQVPGLTVVQTGSYGGATSLFIRGGESKFAKVLVDGVAVNDAGGAFDFSSLSTDNLDRIEIVRGPASVLYGSDAMAGVVQLFTRQGSGSPHIDLSARGGKYATYDGDLAIRGADHGVDYSVSGARHATDGIQLFNSAFKQSVGSGTIGWHGTDADARLTARFTDDNLHYPTDGSGQVVDSNATRRDDRLVLGFDGGLRLSSAASLQLALASSGIHAITDNQPDGPTDTQGYYYTTGDRSYRRSADLRINATLVPGLELTSGAQTERQWQTSATQSNFGPSSYSARRRSTGYYSQLLYGADNYTATVGGRFEHSQTFGDFFTYRAAANVNPFMATRLHASTGTAFREPTMLENFGGGFVIGDSTLSPEQAHSFDAGIEQSLDQWGTISVTGFWNWFSNLIDYKYSAKDPNYFNVAKTKTSGAELGWSVQLPGGFHGDASFTYLDARVVDPGKSMAATAAFAPGARLLRRPMQTMDFGAGYGTARGTFDVRVHRSGTREDVFFAPDFSSKRVSLPAYVRTDASGELPLMPASGRSVTMTARIENLFDVRYSEVAGVNYDFSRTDDASINHTGYRAPGRRALLGLRLSL